MPGGFLMPKRRVIRKTGFRLGTSLKAPRCLDVGAIIIMEAIHEKTKYAWDYRWSRVIECGALLASMVAKECGALP